MKLAQNLAIPFLAAMLGLSSCGTSETLTFESGPIMLTAEGPLFEGTNTAQGPWSPDLVTFLQEHGATVDQLHSANVVEARLEAAEGEDLQGIRSVSMMLVSDVQDMVQVAGLSPLPSGTPTVDLITASEQKGLAVHLEQKAVTVVADLELEADSEADRHVIGSFTLELKLKR